MSKLEGKVAIVTGASKGIGAGIARRLAEAGAAVVVNYASSKAGADRVVADIARDGGRAIAVQGNVANPADIDRLFVETPSRRSADSTSWSTTPGSTSSHHWKTSPRSISTVSSTSMCWACCSRRRRP
jgi:NAD(P)-dependent dehydrogenase (short-subunit alcohol dehydrogenase family)